MTIPTGAPTPLTRPDGSPVRALVVDDEPSLGELIQMALRYEGWQVETATDGATALAKARAFQPDVVVLDIMMPGLDGLEVLKRLRASGDDVAVLFLTAKDAVTDRVVGLTAGGDDYVTKPFSLEEVVARLRSLLRRTGRAVTGYTDPVIRVGDLTLDEESYEVTRAGASDRAHREGVRAAALPDAQSAPGGQQAADPRPGVELRLRGPLQHRRDLHLLPAQEDRGRRARP